MTIARYQRDEFAEHLRNRTTIQHPEIDDLIDWIRDNLEPAEVFTSSQLESWAEGNDYVSANNASPEDVFKSSDLEYWAENNGFRKQQEA